MDSTANIVVIDKDGVVDRYGTLTDAETDYPEAVLVERNDERLDAEFRIMVYTEEEAAEIEATFKPHYV